MTFPLYQDLMKNTNEVPLTDEEKDELIKRIKKLDTLGHELVYALIRNYQIEHETTYEIPYDGKNLKLGLKFDLEKIPNRLSQIIFKFSEKHLEKMKEDKNLSRK